MLAKYVMTYTEPMPFGRRVVTCLYPPAGVPADDVHIVRVTCARGRRIGQLKAKCTGNDGGRYMFSEYWQPFADQWREEYMRCAMGAELVPQIGE